MVRDFADFSFHSYFSVMDGMVRAKVDETIDHKYCLLKLDYVIFMSMSYSLSHT